jgi:hypothetical protein
MAAARRAPDKVVNYADMFSAMGTENAETLEEILQCLYAECCARNKALKPESVIPCSK